MNQERKSDPTFSGARAGYEGGSWFGLGAPRVANGAVVTRLNAAVNDGLRVAEARAALDRLIQPKVRSTTQRRGMTSKTTAL